MLVEYALLCLAAVAAGAINAVAGGGTLLTFPALLLALGSSSEAAVAANATSTVALVPGAIAALAGYRDEIIREQRWAALLLAPSLIGGFIGSLLMVQLPSDVFKTLVPWLILTAAVLFALQPSIARWVGLNRPSPPIRDLLVADDQSARATVAVPPESGLADNRPISVRMLTVALTAQFLVAVYGGYFGAGIGILMLSSLALMGMEEIHRMNAVKTFLALAINGTSVLVFVASGLVHWRFAAAMALSSIVGGYLAARTIRTVNKRVVRLLIVGIGFTLATYYFYRELLG